MPHLNYPILVGFGQITDRVTDPENALDPVGLMAEAARRAETDAGVSSLLKKADSVRVVNVVSWSYGDAPAVLAERLGITPSDRVYTTIGGNTPQLLINETADAVVRGKVRIALLAGAEAFNSLRLARNAGIRLNWPPAAGAPSEVLGDERWGTQDLENRHGASMPTSVYPLFENALRAARGETLSDQRARLGRLCARFSEIAARNPYSWFREPKSAVEVSTVTAANRMIGFPYPKFMNSIIDVNQGAAVILTSVGVARELGIPEERWIYLLAGADAHDQWFMLDRLDFRSSPAIRRIGRAALDQARLGIDDVDVIDFYSCFPCAPEIARTMLGITEDDPRDLTVTGSLMYFGGPGNNYSLHAVATLAEKLRARPGSRGLVTALGWYVTKHSVGLYSSKGPDHPWQQVDSEALQRKIDAEPHPAVAAEPDGAACVETYTVVHDRDGTPQRGIVIGRLGDGRRFIANSPADRSFLEAMEQREWIGERGRVSAGGAEGTNLFVA